MYIVDGSSEPRDHPLDEVYQDIEDLREEYADLSREDYEDYFEDE
jgi:hypothetical protein